MYFFAGYDAAGNLFVDGASVTKLRLAELPAGGKSLQIVHLNGPKIRPPGNVQYDGSELAIGQEKPGIIYRFASGTLTGSVALKSACFVQQFYIYGNRVIAPNVCGPKGSVSIYNYPAGGAPIKTLSGLNNPFGVVVSN